MYSVRYMAIFLKISSPLAVHLFSRKLIYSLGWFIRLGNLFYLGAYSNRDNLTTNISSFANYRVSRALSISV
jgi:hypothetical protein